MLMLHMQGRHFPLSFLCCSVRVCVCSGACHVYQQCSASQIRRAPVYVHYNVTEISLQHTNQRCTRSIRGSCMHESQVVQLGVCFFVCACMQCDTACCAVTCEFCMACRAATGIFVWAIPNASPMIFVVPDGQLCDGAGCDLRPCPEAALC